MKLTASDKSQEQTKILCAITSSPKTQCQFSLYLKNENLIVSATDKLSGLHTTALEGVGQHSNSKKNAALLFLSVKLQT